MALNSSGPISLAGTTAGQSIEIENGGNGTTQISLNDAAVRTLAGVPSGAITMPTNFYGKSNRATPTYTFSANTTQTSINIATLSGYSAGKSDVTITIGSGIYLYSTSTGSPALSLSGGTTGDTLTIVNNGYIMGMGGNGRGQTYQSGLPGGPAISLGYPATINNTNASAYIGGGGGSGGASNAYNGYAGSGGGAGGGLGGSYGYQPGNAPGGAAGSAGGSGANAAGGGGGGRIFPGTGGAGGYASNEGGAPGAGGGAGGGGAALRGSGKASTQVTASGGGGGWGASGGSGNTSEGYSARGGSGGSGNASGGNGNLAYLWYGGGGGGNAVVLNGKTVTWTSGDTTRVYGAVS